MERHEPKERILGDQRPALRLVRGVEPPRLELPSAERRPTDAPLYLGAMVVISASTLLGYILACCAGVAP
jgi:hypothetical protein